MMEFQIFLDTNDQNNHRDETCGLGLTNQIGANIGDYQIDDEIVRIKNNPHPHQIASDPSNPLTVFVHTWN